MGSRGAASSGLEHVEASTRTESLASTDPSCVLHAQFRDGFGDAVHVVERSAGGVEGGVQGGQDRVHGQVEPGEEDEAGGTDMRRTGWSAGRRSTRRADRPFGGGLAVGGRLLRSSSSWMQSAHHWYVSSGVSVDWSARKPAFGHHPVRVVLASLDCGAGHLDDAERRRCASGSTFTQPKSTNPTGAVEPEAVVAGVRIGVEQVRMPVCAGDHSRDDLGPRVLPVLVGGQRRSAQSSPSR